MPEGNPINEILQMRQQGISNNQIIQNLQREGYTNTQIFDAMNNADTKMAVQGVKPNLQQQSPPPSTNDNSSPDIFTHPPVEGNNPAPPPASPQQRPEPLVSSPSPQPMTQPSGPEPVQNYSPQSTNAQVKVEELVEAIVEEKWDELLKDVNKIVHWKNKVETRLSEVEVKLDHLKESYAELQKAIFGKVNEYDKHIQDVGSEIKAMEKVFSKVLPVFTENINELSTITKKLKEDKK
jgi:hypothetical protein